MVDVDVDSDEANLFESAAAAPPKTTPRSSHDEQTKHAIIDQRQSGSQAQVQGWLAG